jgi:sporulation protein YlmC with PRC-barrel domain
MTKRQTGKRLRGVIGGLLAFSMVMALSLSSQAQEQTMLASRMIDRDVLNKQGQKIGETDDLVIKRSGKIKRVTLETGGFLDIADKLVAVSLNEIEIKDGRIILGIPQDQAEKRPEFDYFRRGLRPSYYYRPGPYPPPPAYRYRYGRYYWHRSAPPYPGEEEEMYPSTLWAVYPDRFLASVLMDRYVIDHEGGRMGWVEDLVIDTQEGEIKSFIFSSQDILGEDTYVAVPYKPLGFTPYGLVCEITPEELKKLPEYSYED